MKKLGTRGSLDTCKCGTKAQKRPRGGKRRYAHKCPHGKWCAFGDRILGHHANHNNLCRECRAEETAQRLNADKGYQRALGSV